MWHRDSFYLGSLRNELRHPKQLGTIGYNETRTRLHYKDPLESNAHSDPLSRSNYIYPSNRKIIKIQPEEIIGQPYGSNYMDTTYHSNAPVRTRRSIPFEINGHRFRMSDNISQRGTMSSQIQPHAIYSTPHSPRCLRHLCNYLRSPNIVNQEPETHQKIEIHEERVHSQYTVPSITPDNLADLFEPMCSLDTPSFEQNLCKRNIFFPPTNTLEYELDQTEQNSIGSEQLGVKTKIFEKTIVDAPKVSKEHILDRLMVCVHDLLTPTWLSAHHNQGSSPSSSPLIGPKYLRRGEKKHGKKSNTKKRFYEWDGNGQDGGQSGDMNDRPRKRQGTLIRSPSLGVERRRRFVCPYFKKDPLKPRSSGVCSGPGWQTIPRLKEHLHRDHTMPIHCRRCYVIFEHEAQLAEHSQSTESCVKQDPIPMEGFDQNQGKLLRSRKLMFRAKSDEEKWNIIYLILFPDTAAGSQPSPYYEEEEKEEEKDELDIPFEEMNNASPEPLGVQQFGAFLKRELPRLIRKELQTVLESKIGPLEETLKNELEDRIKSCQERLTKQYFENTRSQDSPPSLFAESLEQISPAQPLFGTGLPEKGSTHTGPLGSEALSHDFTLFESTTESRPEMLHITKEDGTDRTQSEPPYYSLLEQNDNLFDGTWLQSILADETPEANAEKPSGENVCAGISKTDPFIES
ncbi:hypothetical protein GQ44DRAFT_762312 [Phaeosphaeriaceae sp. PMI808]|nr:hypothetical protein GQ44DRAFT_762312 [Phaeosphaeriaceae sp. PMI808]